MQTIKNRKSLAASLLLVGGLVALTATMGATFNSMSLYFHPVLHQPVAQQQAEIDTNWRYTRFGWQDSSFWQRTPADLEPRTIDRISPVLFSIDIILAVLGAMIWASEDWQVDRLFGRESRRKHRWTFDDLVRKAQRLRAQRKSKP